MTDAAPAAWPRCWRSGGVLLGPIYIRLLQRLGFGKAIRVEGRRLTQVKAGTPTLGGMLIVVVVMFLAMAMRLEDVSTLTPMLTLVGVGILGAIDDYVNARTGFGVRGRYKLVWQTVVSVLAASYIQRHFDITAINVPLVGELAIGAVAVVVFVAFAIVAMSNAVNLTDGLDGLASGILVFSFVAYLLIALVEVPGLKLSQPNWRCSVLSSSEPSWASSGSMSIRPRSSWAMPGPFPWGRPWPWWRRSPASSCCS